LFKVDRVFFLPRSPRLANHINPASSC